MVLTEDWLTTRRSGVRAPFRAGPPLYDAICCFSHQPCYRCPGPHTLPWRLMPSSAAARPSLSVPTTASPAQNVTGARVSVSSPTWSSRCGPSEILSARWRPKMDKVARPCEGATAKSAGPRESAPAAKPAANASSATNPGQHRPQCEP